MKNWNNPKTKKLFNAFLLLKTTEEVANFCRDLLTEPEIEEFASRLEIATLLDQGKTQRDVSRKLKVSITTVTRVNQWLRRGMGGYNTVLKRIASKKVKHQHPGRV